MRKLIVLSFISLDGVMQAPGGPDEDTADEFNFGGWTVPFADEFSGHEMARQMGMPFDLLLGRKTYDIFAGYWPNQDESNPVTAPFNKATKYVVSHGHPDLSWKNSKLLNGDIPALIGELKTGNGPILQVHGSGNLIHTLLKHNLVDEWWLKTFPVILGGGKKLFADGAVPTGLKLIDSRTSPKGVIFASYERAGEVQTGTFD